MPVFMPIVSEVQGLPLIMPYMSLTEDQQRTFLQRIQEIQEKEQQLHNLRHPVQHNLLTTIISLAKQKVLMECSLMFSYQLLQNEPSMPGKKRVFITFLLALSSDYREHREVQYYIEQQNMTPCNMSIIINRAYAYGIDSFGDD